MATLLLVLCFLGLAGFLLVTGFHDAPNAVAVAIRTRALTAKYALGISAAMNFIGFSAAAVVFTSLADKWLTLPSNNVGLAMMLTALIAQISWGLITFWLRLPSSSTHALLGGLLGATWATRSVGITVGLPFAESTVALFALVLLVVPLLIFGVSWLLVIPLSSWVARSYPRQVNKVSRNSLSIANSLISLIHGVQIGQRSIMIFLMICLAGGLATDTWLITIAGLFCALILAVGTLMGGGRIGHTFAYKMVRIDPFRGSVAQGSTATFMILGQLLIDAPISSSHLAASSVLGAGLNQRFSSVRPGIVLKLLLTWFFTIPAAFCIAAIFMLALSPLLAS